jgi:hypothetical protein
MAVGEEESPRIIEEVLSGRRPAPARPPKGPKPIIGWKPEDEGPTSDDVHEEDAPTVAPPATAVARSRVPGPQRPEDAWMWEGVPEGRSLIGRAMPGKMRYYMDDDGHGPQFRWLPAAWPPGQGPEEVP